MIRNIGKIFGNFFLHIEINNLNLPYITLPRPRKANKVSKILRAHIFDKHWIRRVFGVNLAAAMMVLPVLGQLQPESNLEPSLNIPQAEIYTTDNLPPVVTTQPREYVLPVERLRYVGQYFRPGHAAYDLNSYVGDDVMAFSKGTVSYLESGKFGLGRYIIVDHGAGLMSVYAHLKDFSVSIGDLVDAGEKIGEVGMTGYTTGPHLHFEIYDNGKAVNPRTYLGI
jgi:murein DD-endopeptidase MepM/ murein hydrolase activator NlpD